MKRTAPPGMSFARWRVLRLLSASGSPSVRQMGATLGGMAPNGVHSHLRGLRDDGLAATTGEVGGWRLTEDGVRYVRQAREWGVR
jgi:predicted transcriptional regulator